MTYGEWLAAATKLLTTHAVESARIDCLVLLEDVTGKDRSHILAYLDVRLTKQQLSHLDTYIERRITHEPLAYIRGKSEFYGREFVVNSHTLQPRPETETMIELMKELPISQGIAVDIGTGSGCIAISTKLEKPILTVIATDISNDALLIAQTNAQNLGADVRFIEGDLLEPITQASQPSPDILMCNLPYVPARYPVNKAATHEPELALYGGDDGLDLYRKLFEQITKYTISPTYILCESLMEQHQQLAHIAAQHHYRLHKTKDLIQVFMQAEA